MGALPRHNASDAAKSARAAPILVGGVGAPTAIGVTLTESWQLVPEQSTAAIVVPNPATVHFDVRE
jgi:hypothetical protein